MGLPIEIVLPQGLDGPMDGLVLLKNGSQDRYLRFHILGRDLLQLYVLH
jgi:hypothetical protein